MTIVWGIIGLGVIVLIHELGHFAAAKLTGIGVDAFSIGMGPAFFRKKIGATEFRLSVFPIGGYCSLQGDNAFQQAVEAKLAEIPKEPHSFFENPFKRFFIAFAGPFANLIFAVIAFTCISLIGYSYQSTTSRVLLVTDIYPEMASAAKDAGILSGDTITAINGDPVTNFSDLYTTIATHPDETLALTIDRDGEILDINIRTDMEKSTASGKIGVMSWIDPIVTIVKPDSPAAQAGLQADDIICAVDGIAIKNTAEMQKHFENKDNTVLTVTRPSLPAESQTLHIELPLSIDEETNAYNLGIGFPFITVDVKQNSFFGALASGIKETGEMLTLTLKTITWFFKGIDISSAVSGPIRITVMLGEAAESGFSESFSQGLITVLNFLSLISISLFIMNLLPIPVLDGGIMLFAVIEAIRGRGIAPSVLYKVQIGGFILIACLFVIAITGDIQYVFARLQSLFSN